MADEHYRAPGDAFRPDAPPANALPPHHGDSIRPGRPTNPTSAAAAQDKRPSQAGVGGVVRWFLGLLIVLAVWAIWPVIGLTSPSWKVGFDLGDARWLAVLISFGVFFFLERDLWLSRFMGLRTVTSKPLPVLEAVLLAVLGPIYVLFRSPAGEEVIEEEAAPAPGPPARGEAAGKPAAKGKQAPAHPKDAVREVIETVVFVVVLVLLLKTFIAEAFVIPTGSMAETLLGYHRNVTCPDCGERFPVNFSAKADPQNQDPQEILGCECPNCRLPIAFDVSGRGRPGEQP